jgi:hypothetical protein
VNFCAVPDASTQVLADGAAYGSAWGGLAMPEERGTGLGAPYSEAAFLEAASVEAFRILRDELRCYGAPRSLVRAAARAGHDEVRHARS